LIRSLVLELIRTEAFADPASRAAAGFEAMVA
jgi:hypothetical protein